MHANLDLLHVHYALPHAISAILAREMSRGNGVRLSVVTTLHGTDITIVGQDRSYLPITRWGIEQSDAVTAVSRYLKDVTVREFARHAGRSRSIPNFVDPRRVPPRRRLGLRAHPRRGRGKRCSCTCRTSGRSNGSPTSSRSSTASAGRSRPACS